MRPMTKHHICPRIYYRPGNISLVGYGLGGTGNPPVERNDHDIHLLIQRLNVADYSTQLKM